MSSTTLLIRHPVGLHARPAALFVQTAQRFRCEIRVSKDDREGNAKSFRAVLALAVNQNDSVTVRADGPDAAEALAALTALVEDNFGER